MLEIELIREMLPEKWDCRISNFDLLRIYENEPPNPKTPNYFNKFITNILFEGDRILIGTYNGDLNTFLYWADPDFQEKLIKTIEKFEKSRR